jgi:DNA invertase Pin-like site-specific DNA recombinase
VVARPGWQPRLWDLAPVGMVTEMFARCAAWLLLTRPVMVMVPSAGDSPGSVALANCRRGVLARFRARCRDLGCNSRGCISYSKFCYTVGMRAIAYVRVSTDKQAEHGLGLSVQRHAIREWAQVNSCQIVEWYSDKGISGSNGLDTRPGLSAAIGDLEDGCADALVVYRLDRLARKLYNQLTWIERLESGGRQVISVTEPDVGQDEMRVLVRQIMGAIAEYDRATICRRMRDGRKLKADRGGYAYGAPGFGYRAEDKALVADEAEQRAVARIAELHAAGASLRRIVATLTTEGIPPKRGAQWYPATVGRIVSRLAG